MGGSPVLSLRKTTPVNSKSTNKGLWYYNLSGTWKGKSQCGHKLQRHTDTSSKLPEQGLFLRMWPCCSTLHACTSVPSPENGLLLGNQNRPDEVQHFPMPIKFQCLKPSTPFQARKVGCCTSNSFWKKEAWKARFTNRFISIDINRSLAGCTKAPSRLGV